MNVYRYTLCNYPLAQEIECFHRLRGIYHILMFSEIGMFYILSVHLMWEVPPPGKWLLHLIITSVIEVRKYIKI